jgi:chromate transporter
MQPSFSEALRFWTRLGWISFGGPTGQIALMHRELVERKKWIDEKRFLHALNYCLMLPGPEAQQLSIYLGWTMHGIRGGICAGLLFILPAIFILWTLSFIYVEFGSVPVVAAAFHGLVPAIIAIVFNAMLKLGRKTLHGPLLWIVAIAAAILISFFHGAYPIVVLGAGLLGWFLRPRERETSPPPEKTAPVRLAPQLRIAAVCLALWVAPLLAIGTGLGWHSTLAQEGIFFSKTALVTFGGAYAVLPYVAQHAVEYYHWLTPDQMLQGFGLAETTPGPLIMVLQFVGFMGAWKNPGPFSPLAAATLGSFITTWVTFAPCFLFVLAGAPFVDRLIQVKSLHASLNAVSAAVVGVMAQFAIWFAFHAVFPAGQAHADWFVTAVSAGAFAALLIRQVDTVLLIAACAALGVAAHFLL